MPKKVSGPPGRYPRKPKKKARARTISPTAAPLPAAPPERPRVESYTRPAAGRVRAAAAPVVDHHYVTEDLKRVGLIALAMFVVLGILAVFLR